MAATPKVFSIPAGAPFLSVLADAILDGRLARLPEPSDDPLTLAGVTVLLPTRRAVRALRETFVAKLGGDAAILPVIRPIGDANEEEHLLDPGVETAADRLALPPAIGRLARQLALTRLTLAWGRAVRRDLLGLADDEPLLIPASAADAARLAADLSRLMDDIETAGIAPDAIRGLAPEDHAQYFQVTLDFLKIAFESWPAYLAERNLVDPVTRRDSLIRAEAARLARTPPSGPVIAAGSTGTIPATADLLKAIAHLPNGAVVLPGLDRDLDKSGWDAIGAADAASTWSHPQFGLKQLIARLGVARDDVIPLGGPPPSLAFRARLTSEALRPAATTDDWARFRNAEGDSREAEAALGGVMHILAHNEQEEAVAIALLIREALEEPDTRVALVTPDRPLARRVAAELGRWQLAIDNSAGAGLDLLPAGVFARLVADALTADGDPAPLLALLKHPFAAFGMDRAECRKAARVLELAVFRGRRGNGGITALSAALAAARAEVEAKEARHVAEARRRLAPYEWNLAARLVARIEAVLGPAEAALHSGEITVADAATLMVAALDAAASEPAAGVDRLWQGEDGDALATLLAGLVEDADLAIAPADFPPLLATLMGEVSVTRPAGLDPRIHILGALEARLQSFDLLILGGLDEGVWPAETRTDPWLSRAMRAEIGLPPPERRIGLAAHDFTQAFAAPRVVVTRAEKRGGTPTVASRWLQRLFALIGEPASGRLIERGNRYVALARDIDHAWGQRPKPIGRPLPKPVVADRPRRLSVTEIETLIRDPYAVYAKHVLRLEPLDPLGMAPDYALRGSLMHEAIGLFCQGWGGPYDASAVARLLDIGRTALAGIAEFPDIHAIWSTRFKAMAEWLVGWEAKRSGEIARRHAEIGGAFAVEAPAGPFTLRGRADRIDQRTDGRIEILDFKTGTPPSAKQVLLYTPQLALEAAMARAGAFDEALRGRSIAKLFWVGLSRVERGEPIVNAVEEGYTPDGVADEALTRLRSLIAVFDDPDRAYVSRARPMFEMRYESPYDHLARVREWALVESEEDHPEWFGQPKP